VSQADSQLCRNFRTLRDQTMLHSVTQCVVRNAKLSHCETVRNVSHGLRRRPQAGETCETSFAQAIRAKLVSHRQSVRNYFRTGSQGESCSWQQSGLPQQQRPCLTLIRLPTRSAKQVAGLLLKRYGSISSRSFCRQTRLRKRNAIMTPSVGTAARSS